MLLVACGALCCWLLCVAFADAIVGEAIGAAGLAAALAASTAPAGQGAVVNCGNAQHIRGGAHRDRLLLFAELPCQLLRPCC